MQQQELVIKANNSSFRLLLTTYIDRNSGKPSSYNINLGGTKKKCLNLMISVPLMPASALVSLPLEGLVPV